MRVLAVRQPWASLICNGYKCMEIRSYKTSVLEEYIAIYASRTLPKESDLKWIRTIFNLYPGICPVRDIQRNYTDPSRLTYGKILGKGMIYNCFKFESLVEFNTRFFEHLNPPKNFGRDIYGWEFANVYELKNGVPFKFQGSIVWSHTDDDEIDHEVYNLNHPDHYI
ncbi:MAG: hypothetical protein ACLFMM_09145 [Methanohalobium sp.]|uniref:hypothetical protein n=1 Tax=Methanohalobium sp. TaxID=2837493 RepID=UPI00397AA85E